MQGKVDKQAHTPPVNQPLATRTPWLVLLVSMIVTIIVWQYSNIYLAERANERFAFRCEQIVEAVTEHMHDYEQVLRGGVGLWLSTPEVSRQQWHAYVDNAHLGFNYPGIQNMGIAFPVRAEEKDAHVAKIRAEGIPNYSIYPAQPERPFYVNLAYVEPFSGRNLRAVGFDMYTNPQRRAALDRAIEQGTPSMSGMVKLAQETENDAQYGFVMYFPIFHQGMPQRNASERRAAIRAIVVGAFRANDLMRSIFASNAEDFELEIFDDGILKPENRLYASFKQSEAPASAFVRTELVELSGHKWLLRIRGNQHFLASVSSLQSTVILAAGILLNIALFATLTSLSSRERRARWLAEEMTRDLFDKESHFGRIISSSSEAIVSMTPNGQVTSWNPAATKIFGYDEAAALRLPVQALLHNDQDQEEYGVLQQLADGNLFQHFETRYQHRDGHWVDVAVSPSLQHDADGKLIGATLIMRDISERKQAKKQLFDLQYQMLQWVEELPIGLFVLNQDGKTHYANRRAMSLLGRGIKHDAEPEDLAELYSVYREGTDELYPTDELPVVQALAGKVCMIDDIEIALENGRRKLKVWGQPVFSADGKVEFGVAAFEDITERKLALEIQALYADIVASSHDAIMSIKLDGTIT
ncbi:MAG: CHASE domain-containing protein, partial [Burkholderiales bacterium]|nr:CHASE domain-containing protein [Burkholderiales bacterium]